MSSIARRPSRYVAPSIPIVRIPGDSEGSAIACSVDSQHSVDLQNPDPDVVRKVGRHLVNDKDGFDSLKLQSGDVTREIYNWQREHDSPRKLKVKRSKSFTIQPDGDPDVGVASDILVPGGFRREFVATHGTDNESVLSFNSQSANHLNSTATGSANYNSLSQTQNPAHDANLRRTHSFQNNGSISGVPGPNPYVFTRNFIEFLSLYGHFAGEDLEESEDEDDSESDRPSRDGDNSAHETAPLLRPNRPGRHHRTPSYHQSSKGQASTVETVMLLLKSFVGTGVLFLPRAFYNGGILFSSTVLVLVSMLTYFCFLLLIETKEYTKMGSFGDIGGVLLGESSRKIVLGSIVISQIGFSAAYVVFVAENLRSFFSNISNGKSLLKISTLIVSQLFLFLPLSMIRDIAKLGFTALIADAFILAGLIYLYSWSGVTLLEDGIADVKMFNSSSWTLFIGTAVFTYEGIGLIIPIQESMRQPQKFSKVLGFVMIAVTFVFVSVGALLYAACGSQVETVILLNLPNSGLTNVIQLLYSIAIMLSTPLQLFPAIRILENALFVRSGKFSRKVKWQKNVFRFFVVFLIGIVAYIGADDLDKFVALIGSVACVPLVYIYPPLLHMQIKPKFSFQYCIDVLIVIIGAAIMAYTSTMTVLSWIKD